MSSLRWIPLVLSLVLTSQNALASGTVRRFVLAAGANSGGPTRVPLRYAVSDAESFTQVMIRMGGVDPADQILLRQPDREAFEDAVKSLRAKISKNAPGVGRTEVLLYYSGHADDEGLLLGSERLSYQELRDLMDAIPADVRITVLDACASGAITRMKGGQRRKAFLVDASSDMQGYAFLTSSSPAEAAQESDRIGASFFTHYLVSGLQGAADVSGEGKVTLGEAYQFAFHETLESTTATEGGAQHPAYQINLSGTGDVVMTDIRQSSADLVLAEELNGRFFVRDANRRLVAELFKPAGRVVELGLEPGEYEIHLERKPALLVSSQELKAGDRLVLGPDSFRPITPEATVSRGESNQTESAVQVPGGGNGRGLLPASLDLTRRFRLELSLGKWGRGPKEEEGVAVTGTTAQTRAASWDLMFALGFSRWLSDDLSAGIRVSTLGVDASVDTRTAIEGVPGTGTDTGVSTKALEMVALLFELRKYLGDGSLDPALHPYLAGGVGTYIGAVSRTSTGTEVVTEAKSMGAFGVQLGAGLDVRLGRNFMIGPKAGYNLMTDFREPLGGRKNYSGPELSVGLSWLFGKGIRSGT